MHWKTFGRELKTIRNNLKSRQSRNIMNIQNKINWLKINQFVELYRPWRRRTCGWNEGRFKNECDNKITTSNRSFIHSSGHPFIYLFIHLLIHPFIYLFLHFLDHSFTNSYTHSSTKSFNFLTLFPCPQYPSSSSSGVWRSSECSGSLCRTKQSTW